MASRSPSSAAGRRRLLGDRRPAASCGRSLERIGRPATSRCDLVGLGRDALVGDADEVAIDARAGVHRHDPAADLVADDDDRPGPRRDRRERSGDRAVEDRIGPDGSSPRSALSHSVRPSIRTGSAGSVARGPRRDRCRRRSSASRRALAAVAGDPVVELGVARPGRREEPGPAAARQPPGRGQPEAALAAARAAEGEDQRAGHVTAIATATADDRPRRRQLDDRAQDVAVELAAESGRGRARRRGRAPHRREPAPKATARASNAGDHRTTAAVSRRRRRVDRADRAANQAPSRPADRVAAQQRDDDRQRPRRRAGGDAGQRGDQGRAARQDARLASAATSVAEDEDERRRPRPTRGRVLARRLGPRRVARQQGVGRVGQPVEVDRAVSRAIVAMARTAASSGTTRPGRPS